MRTVGVVIRIMFKIVKWAFAIYAMWDTIMASRWVAVTVALYRLLRGKPKRDVKKSADWMFVNGGEPAVYERRGWRKLGIRRRI